MEKKISLNRIIMLFLFSIAVSLITSIATFYYLSSIPIEEPSSPQIPMIKKTQTIAVQQNLATNDISNWKTYSASKWVSKYGSAYNFSVKYPSNYTLREQDHGTVFDLALLSPDYKRDFADRMTEKVLTGFRIELFIIPNQKINTLEEWFNSYYYNFETKSIMFKAMPFKMNDNTTGLYYSINNGSDGGVFSKVFSNKNNVYKLSIVSKNNISKYIPLLDQILSTFKFLE